MVRPGDLAAEAALPEAARRRRLAVGGLLALALEAFVLWLFIVHVPEQLDADPAVILRAQPDLALLLVPTLVLAAVWGPLRSLLLAWVWLHLRHRPPSDEGSRTTPAGEEAATEPLGIA